MINHRHLRRFRYSAMRWVFLYMLALLCVEQASSQDPGWPREKTVNGTRPGSITSRRSTPGTISNYSICEWRSPLLPAGGKTQPGVVTAEMQTEVNMDAHTVLLSHPLITGTYFPSLDPAASAKLSQLVESFLPPTAMLTISLDRLAASANKTQTESGRRSQERSSGDLFQLSTRAAASVEWPAGQGPSRELESGVRCELELAAFSGQIDLAVLPL